MVKRLIFVVGVVFAFFRLFEIIEALVGIMLFLCVRSLFVADRTV